MRVIGSWRGPWATRAARARAARRLRGLLGRLGIGPVGDAEQRRAEAEQQPQLLPYCPEMKKSAARMPDQREQQPRATDSMSRSPARPNRRAALSAQRPRSR